MRSSRTFTSYSSLLRRLVFVQGAGVTGVLADATMSRVAADLIITTVIGGILWLLASFVGLV